MHTCPSCRGPPARVSWQGPPALSSRIGHAGLSRLWDVASKVLCTCSCACGKCRIVYRLLTPHVIVSKAGWASISSAIASAIPQGLLWLCSKKGHFDLPVYPDYNRDAPPPSLIVSSWQAERAGFGFLGVHAEVSCPRAPGSAMVCSNDSRCACVSWCGKHQRSHACRQW